MHPGGIVSICFQVHEFSPRRVRSQAKTRKRCGQANPLESFAQEGSEVRSLKSFCQYRDGAANCRLSSRFRRNTTQYLAKPLKQGLLQALRSLLSAPLPVEEVNY